MRLSKDNRKSDWGYNYEEVYREASAEPPKERDQTGSRRTVAEQIKRSKGLFEVIIIF